jgi:hypothetical protein
MLFSITAVPKAKFLGTVGFAKCSGVVVQRRLSAIILGAGQEHAIMATLPNLFTWRTRPRSRSGAVRLGADLQEPNLDAHELNLPEGRFGR